MIVEKRKPDGVSELSILDDINKECSMNTKQKEYFNDYVNSTKFSELLLDDCYNKTVC